MALSRLKLYALLLVACFAAYCWIYFGLIAYQTQVSSVELCLFKQATRLPCPSCGSTRSVLALLNGDFSSALMLNPLGYFIAAMMFVLPLWMLFDFVYRRDSLWQCYQKVEVELKKPLIAIPLIVLILANWIWNMYKGI